MSVKNKDEYIYLKSQERMFLVVTILLTVTTFIFLCSLTDVMGIFIVFLSFVIIICDICKLCEIRQKLGGD